ncbi:alpha/beta hydrolase [Lysinibacillus sp. CNPSo 3705]|uniref:alpha/beta fold hydrolase n=1 Tax=Lysinibacillus sp. CNPSo 3705 TaxID=3028148 RepID=UPI0023644601|nr:alpha/beta hydrolase [Lysinibacillus sp. CNPSo 3705]MDD1502388.1 alpha/beta hydrolase [Lysinibacillus sp. CNPSo 3705]
MRKIVKKIAIYFIAVILIGLVTIFSFDRYQLSKESKLLDTIGTLVEVDHQKINVYTEGDGHETYVFMAGSGVAAPIYEMKGLYSKFSQGHKIAVIERAGYGYSDVSKDERDIDTLLAQTREALQKSGNKPPYILVPHSISGVEAIYWAQKYPEEIKGIIALDIGLPSQYVEHKMGVIDLWTVKGMNLLTKLGVHRLTPSQVYNPEVMKQSFLSAEEKEIYKAQSYKQVFNDDMKNELLHVYENSLKSEALPKPKDTPILIIDAITEQNKDSNFTKYHSQKYAEFAEQINIAEVKELSGTHSIYLYKPDEIYNLAIAFMETKVGSKER